jgi:hypothetical protein
MTKPRRRQAGEGGISQYLTKAGPRFLIKYTATLEDGSTKVVLRRGFPTRKAAAEALSDANVEIRQGRHVLPSSKTVGRWGDEHLASLRLAPSTRCELPETLAAVHPTPPRRGAVGQAHRDCHHDDVSQT